MAASSETHPPRLQMLVLDRTDPSRNMARFYVLSIEPTLFGDTALIREWGRLGQQGRRRLDLYASPDRAVEALDEWLRRKVRRGYQVSRRGGCFTPGILTRWGRACVDREPGKGIDRSWPTGHREKESDIGPTIAVARQA